MDNAKCSASHDPPNFQNPPPCCSLNAKSKKPIAQKHPLAAAINPMGDEPAFVICEIIMSIISVRAALASSQMSK